MVTIYIYVYIYVYIYIYMYICGKKILVVMVAIPIVIVQIPHAIAYIPISIGQLILCSWVISGYGKSKCFLRKTMFCCNNRLFAFMNMTCVYLCDCHMFILVGERVTSLGVVPA